MSQTLNADLVIAGYKQGIYPMGTQMGIRWFSPDPRCIIPLDDFHIPRRLARKYRQKVFTMEINTAWNEVLFNCANRKDSPGLWISEEIKEAYTELYQRGMAFSIEAYSGTELAGGLYGVSIGGAFMAESMFHLVTDASKFCLVYLIEHLKQRGYVLLDTQDFSLHKAQFGAILIPRVIYLEKLAYALTLNCQFMG